MDAKLLATRKKLQALKYPQTLHPSSVDLVERLLSDHTKLLKQYENLKNKFQQLENQAKKVDNDDKIDYLNQKNYELTEQIKRLKESSRDSGVEQKISKMSKALQEIQIKYEYSLQENNEERQHMSLKIDELTIKNRKLTEQTQKVKGQLQQQQQEFDSQHTELLSLLQKKNKDIKELQQLNSKQRLKVSSMEGVIDSLKSDCERDRSTSSNSNNRVIEVLKEEYAGLEGKLQLAKVSLQEQIKQGEEYKAQIKKLNEKIERLQCEEKKGKSLECIQLNMKQKLEKMHEETKEALDHKIQEVEVLRQGKKHYESEIEKMDKIIKDSNKKNKVLTQNLSTLQEQIKNLTCKYSQKVKELRESENVKIALQRQALGYQDRLRQQEQEANELRAKKRVTILEPEAQTAYDYEVKLLKEEIESYKQNQHQLVMEIQRHTIQSKRLQHIISEGSKQLAVTQGQKEDLIRENRELQKKLQSGHSVGNSSKNQIVRLKQKIEKYEGHIEDLEEALREQRNSNQIINSEILKISGQLKKEKESNRAMHEDNKQMAIQLRDMECRRKEMMQQLQAYKTNNHGNQEKSVEHQKIINELNMKVDTLREEIRRKEAAILAIDMERDENQALLDDKTNKVEELTNYIQNMERDIKTYNRGKNELDMSMNALERRARSLEDERDTLRRQCQQLSAQLKDCRQVCCKNELHGKELENQIHLLVMSNSELKKEAQRWKNKIVEIERRLKDKQKAYEEEMERAAHSQISNKEITEQLHKERIQIKRLGGLVIQLEQVNNEIYYHLQNRDAELKDVHSALEHSERRQAQLMNQISCYERQLQQISEELESKQEEISHLSNQRNCLRAERNLKTSSNSSVDWKLVLETRNEQLQAELEKKRANCQELRKRVRFLQAQLNGKSFQLAKESQCTPIKKVTSQSLIESQNCNLSNQQFGDLLPGVNDSIDSRALVEKIQRIEHRYEATKHEQNIILRK